MKNLFGLMFVALLMGFILSSELFSCQEPDCVHYGAIKCMNPFTNRAEHKKIQEKLLEDEVRPSRKYTFTSHSGYFLIHYDTEGEHKVDITDIDNNGIPDYVDSTAYFFDQVFQKEIVELGYIQPLKDTLGGSDLFDVYITQLCNEGTAIYGLTGMDYETLINEKLIKGVCYIYIDNDFSATDSVIVGNGKKAPAYFTKSFDALKITAAHEFHHAIQFAYGFTVTSSVSLNEMYSTYMERVNYPEIKDYFQYVNDLMTFPMNFPFGLGEAQIGYRWSLFAEYLDIIGGSSLLRSVWEIISNENDGYTALDSALIKHNSSLNQGWKDFLNYIYFTSERAQGDKYLKNADVIRKISLIKSFNLVSGSQQHTDIINPYQVSAFRVNLDNPITKERTVFDFLISCFDSISVKSQEILPLDYEFEISTIANSGFKKVDGYELYYQIKSNGNLVDGKYFINEGILNGNETFTFPQPFKQNRDNDLSFVLKLSNVFEQSAKIEILNMELNPVFSTEADIVINAGFKTLKLNNEDLKKIGTGKFYYNINLSKVSLFGKFVIID